MSIAVTTRSFDGCRSGGNLQETVLTQAAVRGRGMVRVAQLPLPGDARGSEGMSLLIPGRTMADGEVHDLLIQATMGNDVFCFDADSLVLLWEQRVGDPIPGTRAMDMYLINDHWGILGTPVINPATFTIHVVAMSAPGGNFAKSRFWLHSLSPIDGSPVRPALDLTAATYQPPAGLPLQRMGTVPRKQRCGLAISADGAIVYVANGSFNEDADTNQGWLIAADVSAATPTLDATFTTTSRYSGGGVWMGGQAPAVDPASGDILMTVGNGAFDGLTDWGESVIRLRHTRASAGAPGSLAVIDHFTPYTDTGRVAGTKAQTLPDTSLIPGADGGRGGTSNMDSASDEDLNSGGPLLVTRAMSGLPWAIVIVAGKDGIGYFIDADDMGAPTLADFAPNLIQTRVYGKLLLPPYWLTYYNPTATAAPTDLSTIPTTYLQRTHHLHSTCVFYRSPVHGPMIFCMGENANVRAYGLAEADGRLAVSYLGCSVEYASPEAPVPPGGMPGGMMTLSADGRIAGTALLHVVFPYGNANNTITPGRYVIYDAENFGRFDDGSGWIQVIWDTQAWNIAFLHNKFNLPMAANGRVFLPTYGGTVDVYELTAQA